MFTHQYDFDIEIPREVITNDKHNQIFEKHLEDKVIVGLCGYGKSGKDTIAKLFVERYNFHRVAFADNLKIEMNQYLKKPVLNYLSQPAEIRLNYHEDVRDGLILEDGRTLTLEDIDFLTEDIPVKKRLRPFIIWYGEKIREINGPYYWINKAFELNAKNENRIILSDVRRIKELEIFENSNAQNRRLEETFISAGCQELIPEFDSKNYSTFLFHVNQLGLTDQDKLTIECIKVAQERWLFDDEFKVDPRLPQKGGYRYRFISANVTAKCSKFGIKALNKEQPVPNQSSMFDNKNF